MRDAGASYKVTKNTLTLIALEGSPYAPISDMLTGPTALATSADPVAAAKVAVDFAKTTDRFEIVGGAMGDTLLDASGIEGAGRAAVARRAAREDHRPHPGAGEQDRPHDQRARRDAGPGDRRLAAKESLSRELIPSPAKA